MKSTVVTSGDYVATTGIYRLLGVLGMREEITLLYGDMTPLFRGQRVNWELVRAAKHPIKG